MPIEIDGAARLAIPDSGPGNRQRFAAIFRGVWQGIKPEEDREKIVVPSFPSSSLGTPAAKLCCAFAK